MDLDFKTNKYELFDDWHQNKTKQEFTQKFQQQAQVEKTQLPQLLSREDLKIRWQMNSRQSVHQVASKPDFPQPVFAFNQRLIEKGALLEKLLDDHGDAAQTEKELQQLLSAENRYQELKQFTSKIKYQDQSTMFQHFVQEIKSR